VRIPFINEKILVDTISEIDHKAVLSESERQRNILGEEHRFQPTNPLPPSAKQKSVSSKGWGSALQDEKPKRRY